LTAGLWRAQNFVETPDPKLSFIPKRRLFIHLCVYIAKNGSSVALFVRGGMSITTSVSGTKTAVLLSFCEHFTASRQFAALFQEGMRLVDETAEYLDAQGRNDAKLLIAPVSMTYTSESIALTTRLMQIASWLLLRRAIANGEITLHQAETHKRRVYLAPQSDVRAESFDALPAKMQYLIDESHRLHSRIVRLDQLFSPNGMQHGDASNALGSDVANARLAVKA